MAVALAQLPTRRAEAWKWSDLRAAASSLYGSDGALEWDALHVQTYGGWDAGSDYSPRTDIGAVARSAGAGEVLRLIADSPQVREAGVHIIASAVAASRRLQVLVQPGARLRLVEHWDHVAEGRGLSAVTWDIGVANDAELERIVIATGGGAARMVSDAHVRVMNGGRFTQTAVTDGASFARLETHVAVSGEDAHVSLNGVSLLAQERHADHTTVVTHASPGSTTRETFRTAALGQSRGVFQGKIKVERPAQHTDARMNHAALLLSEGASVNAKPELEIYADDVACAHGNTAGALDADGLFYMRQRGLPEARAKALLTKAFLAEALGEVGDEAVAEKLEGAVDAWLEAHV